MLTQVLVLLANTFVDEMLASNTSTLTNTLVRIELEFSWVAAQPTSPSSYGDFHPHKERELAIVAMQQVDRHSHTSRPACRPPHHAVLTHPT